MLRTQVFFSQDHVEIREIELSITTLYLVVNLDMAPILVHAGVSQN